jgi:hypothetical protein
MTVEETSRMCKKRVKNGAQSVVGGKNEGGMLPYPVMVLKRHDMYVCM